MGSGGLGLGGMAGPPPPAYPYPQHQADSWGGGGYGYGQQPDPQSLQVWSRVHFALYTLVYQHPLKESPKIREALPPTSSMSFLKGCPFKAASLRQQRQSTHAFAPPRTCQLEGTCYCERSGDCVLYNVLDLAGLRSGLKYDKHACSCWGRIR